MYVYDSLIIFLWKEFALLVSEEYLATVVVAMHDLLILSSTRSNTCPLSLVLGISHFFCLPMFFLNEL